MIVIKKCNYINIPEAACDNQKVLHILLVNVSVSLINISIINENPKKDSNT